MTDERLLAPFRPIFAEIAAGAARRDRERELPLTEMAALRAAGIGSLRVPVELGGAGATLPQLFTVLRELAAADSNLPQALRQHYFQVELLLLDPTSAHSAPWIERVVAGDLFGSGTTEPRGSALGQVGTVLRRDGDGFRLTGRKIYGTGNAYAQWLPVGAVDEDGNPVFPVVPVGREGVTLLEDWNGFGQRLTATCTTVFEDVRVEAHEAGQVPPGGPTRSGAGLHQAILLATLAGVARGAVREVTQILREKKRVYFTGTGELPRHDAVVQEHLGRLHATADAAAWTVDALGRELESAWGVWTDPSATAAQIDARFATTELVASSAQVTVSEQVLNATAHLLDVLGASSLDSDLGLDRYWRNARALASHNPYPFKARQLGDHLLNGALPPAFAVGQDVGDKK